MCRKRRKKMLSGLRAPIIVPAGPAGRWSTDFVLDTFYISKYEVTVAQYRDYAAQANEVLPVQKF